MKRLIRNAAFISVVSLLSALSAPSAKAADVELRMSSWAPPTHWIVTEGFQPWAREVERVTEGRVRINVLPKAVASPPEHFDLARRGVVDVTYGTYTYQPQRFKLFEFLEFPNGNADAEITSVAAWKTFQEHFAADETHRDVQLLGLFMMGTGAVHHRDRAMDGKDSFSGQKFRMGGPVQQKVIEGLGGTPVAAPISRAYEMLSSGVVDGSLNPYSDVMGFRLDELVPHHSEIPGGFYDASIFLVVNKAAFERIAPEDREAIMSISGEALSKRMGALFNGHNARARQAMIESEATVVSADDNLVNMVATIRKELARDWIDYARGRGYENAEAILSQYRLAIAAPLRD